MKNHINKNVKFREYFRPFAPAVLEQDASNYFHISQKSEHMLIAFDAISKKLNHFYLKTFKFYRFTSSKDFSAPIIRTLH